MVNKNHFTHNIKNKKPVYMKKFFSFFVFFVSAQSAINFQTGLLG